jgi:hypothetical protein
MACDTSNRFKFLRLFLTALASFFAFTGAVAAQWNEQVLYSFQYGTDGAEPVGSIVFDKQGNLYGATSVGGSPSCPGVGGCGTVFELSPPAKNGNPWVETQLHVFQGLAKGDGAGPVGGLVMDSAGNLYGTTAYDGAGQCTLIGSVVGCGTVYEMSPPLQPGGAWTETVLYSFQGGDDGSFPWGDLVFDKAGNLYGSTRFGGGKGTNCNTLYGGNCGTIFELSPPKTKGGAWAEKVLHSFASAGLWSIFGDGAQPNGGLILDEEGNLYGTTYFGGYAGGHCNGGVGGTGCGTVFELIRPSPPDNDWAEHILYRFNAGNIGIKDGVNPSAGVVFDETGNLYGTTYDGGADGVGTVIELMRPAASGIPWAETILYSFTYTNGADPSSPVLIDPRDGSLYITATGAGASRGGTLSRLRAGSVSRNGQTTWSDTVLYNFTGGSSGAGYPYSKLVLHSGALYSNSLYGGPGPCQGGCGTVFKVWP